MLYNRNPHYVNIMQPATGQKFELYADELEALAESARKSDKKEMSAILQRLAQYGRAKAQHSRGPVRFTYN